MAEDAETVLEEGQVAMKLSGGVNWIQGTYARALARAGRHQEAREVSRRLFEAARSSYVSRLGIIDACLAVGDMDGALSAAEQMAGDRSPEVFWLVDEPTHDPLRRMPRFSALLKRIGLPERY